MIKKLALSEIRIDGGTQQRPVDDDVVARYGALMQDGRKSEFEPVDVVFDGKDYWLWNGFHRYHAIRKLNEKEIEASVEDGTNRDAVYYSCSANSKHGFPRQPGTVRAMLLETVFPDQEWSQQTDGEIAEWIGGCTRRHVSMCRKEYETPQKETNSGQAKTQKGSTSHIGHNESPKDSEPKNEGEAETKEPKLTPIAGSVVDSVGKEVPEHLREVFSRIPEIKAHNKLMSDMFKEIRAAVENEDVLYVHCKIDQLKTAVANVRSNLRFTIPYAVCVYCNGDVNNQGCRACNGCGHLNESGYIAASAELKGK